MEERVDAEAFTLDMHWIFSHLETPIPELCWPPNNPPPVNPLLSLKSLISPRLPIPLAPFVVLLILDVRHNPPAPATSGRWFTLPDLARQSLESGTTIAPGGSSRLVAFSMSPPAPTLAGLNPRPLRWCCGGSTYVGVRSTSGFGNTGPPDDADRLC